MTFRYATAAALAIAGWFNLGSNLDLNIADGSNVHLIGGFRGAQQ